MQIKNITDGPRGVHTKNGLEILAPGETREVELSKAEADDLSAEWFATGAKAKADPLDHDGDGRKGGSLPASERGK